MASSAYSVDVFEGGEGENCTLCRVEYYDSVDRFVFQGGDREK